MLLHRIVNVRAMTYPFPKVFESPLNPLSDYFMSSHVYCRLRRNSDETNYI